MVIPLAIGLRRNRRILYFYICLGRKNKNSRRLRKANFVKIHCPESPDFTSSKA